MSKTTLLILAVAFVAVSCSAEAPRFRKANFGNRQFRFFQRQEEAPVEAEPQPAAAPYPPAGVTPATPLELPTEITVAQPSQEYGPPASPSQEYGPPASPSQEYGPPAAEEPAVIVDEGADDEVVVEEQEVVLAAEPESERLFVYRVPSARLIRRPLPLARFIHLEHK